MNIRLLKSLISAVIIALLIFHGAKTFKKRINASINQNATDRTFSIEELALYNGTDNTKPIYLAYKGRVYDVTDGRVFYETGGVYHSLAGRDATADLIIAGGQIIEKKYPVVGILKNP